MEEPNKTLSSSQIDNFKNNTDERPKSAPYRIQGSVASNLKLVTTSNEKYE